MRAAIVGLVIASALPLAAACGGGEAAPETTVVEPAPQLPACAGTGTSPPDLPLDFPLPGGTGIISSESPFANQLVVLGVVPGDLQDAASFFNETLPDHGYQVGIGDAEGTESEAPFTGNGYRGRWRVNAIPDCAALRLTLIFIEQS
jgi:hypothetical protein